MNFHKHNLKPWGTELVNKYPLVFLEADPHNVPWAHQVGVVEADFVNLRYGFECQEGWIKHIENIAKKATELVTYLRDPNLHCLPCAEKDAYIHSAIVKEKMGGLRWQGQYNLPPLFQDLWRSFVSSEENQSYGTCEVTGKHGSIRRTKNGESAWNKTLCTEEAIKQGYDLEEWENDLQIKSHPLS